ncbi:MAG: hypothetical protein C0432_05175 [Candidatus Puniceispirillum sp.]|nr:hypothetical protein [Candidatus Pelagibacter sp.]MBA4283667.1 hypothetical protein [Candidatus Puniceispirillum sp.]
MQETAYKGIKTFQKLSINYLNDLSIKKDPLFSRIIFNWSKIVSQPVAQTTQILKLYTDSSQHKCLLVGCHGSQITLMQMKSGVLLEKINLFLGKKYIQKIIFKAIYIAPQSVQQKKPIVISPEKEKEIESSLCGINDEDIKRILFNLGKEINNKNK